MCAYNLTWQSTSITPNQRHQILQQKPLLLWFTGISGSGKTTLANAVETHLHKLRHHTFLLDGDNIRHGLCKDLGFSDVDRSENIRRVAEVARLFLDAGIITIAAFISPKAQDRAKVRAMFRQEEFIEIYCQCPLEVCEQRDVKGLYKKARSGKLSHFTGVSSPYEAPQQPELIIDTNKLDISSSVNLILEFLYAHHIALPIGRKQHASF
jgi:adenylylsulfate kinase